MRFSHGVTLAGILTLSLTAPAFAQATATVNYAGTPDLQTTAALLQAGGGTTNFSGKALIKFLAGTKSQYEAEMSALNDKFGVETVNSFLNVFTFVFTDAVKEMQSKSTAPLPAANQDTASDAESLAEALYKNGVTDEGFSVTYLFDKLFGHDVHAAVAQAITQKYGEKAGANFETVLTQTMSDMKAGYDL